MRIGLALLLSACGGYAPPAYATHVGAPGSVAPDQGSVQIASNYGVVNLAQGELNGTIALGEGARLELGSSFAGADGSSIGWLLGRVGVRYGERVGRDAAYDLEVGGAAGVGGNSRGGAVSDMVDPLNVYDRPAGGAYLGGGLAHWIDEHALFVRVRTQVGFAVNAPVTFWGSAMVGVDIDFDVLRFHVAGGGYAMATEHSDFVFWLVEAGVTVPIS